MKQLLPPAARGEFLRGKELAALKAKAERDRAYNNARSSERKAELGSAAYRRQPKETAADSPG